MHHKTVELVSFHTNELFNNFSRWILRWGNSLLYGNIWNALRQQDFRFQMPLKHTRPSASLCVGSPLSQGSNVIWNSSFFLENPLNVTNLQKLFEQSTIPAAHFYMHHQAYFGSWPHVGILSLFLTHPIKNQFTHRMLVHCDEIRTPMQVALTLSGALC